ncbi:MAG: PAS domain-containing sensor histidine kinase [Bacteroidota bacterium]
MNFNSLKAELTGSSIQLIVFDLKGNLISSCNTLFELTDKNITNSLYNHIPILESLQDGFKTLTNGEKLKFPCMWFDSFGKSGYFDYIFSRKDDYIIWILHDLNEVYVHQIKLQQERNDSWISAEVLELHKRTQEKLEKVKEDYENLFNNTPDLIQSVDTKGNFLFTNPAWRSTLGYSEKEIEKMELFDVVHPDDIEYCNNIHARLETEKKLSFVELRLIGKEKNIVHLRGSIIARHIDGKLVANQGVYRDITHRKEIEDKLKQSESQYRLLVENASDIILKTDLQGRIVYINEIGLQFIGLPKEELGDSNFIQWVDPNHRKHAREFYLNQSYRKISSTYQELPIVVNDKKSWVGQNVNLLFEDIDGNERLSGFLVIIRDITKQKVLEETLNQTNEILDKKVAERTRELNKANENLTNAYNDLEKSAEELIQNNNELEQFSFIVSHNLRGPVARLIGLTSLFDKVEADEHQTIIDQVHTATNSLDSILSDLTDILQIRKDLYNIKEDININDEIKRVQKILGGEIGAVCNPDNLDIELEQNTIYGVRAYIQSILYNLLSNAFKYRRSDTDLKIKITSKVDNNKYLINIEDNGKGIDMDRFKDKLFRMYSRFDLKTQGRGVGLYLVKKQVEGMNGTISVKSKVNEGTSFYIQIPIPDSSLVEHQLVYDDEWVSIIYNGIILSTQIVWKKPPETQMQRIFEKNVENISKYTSYFWIIDTTNLGNVTPENQEWFNTKSIPLLINTGTKGIVVLNSDGKGFNSSQWNLLKGHAEKIGLDLQFMTDSEKTKNYILNFLQRNTLI